jgi:hypothetical protein
MLPELPPPTCTECGQPTHLVPYTRHYRRGSRVIMVESGMWECLNCPDPFTGERPFRFADAALMLWTDAQADPMWRERYGEPMPPSERGKHPGPYRTMRIPVMLTPDEVARLDEMRGNLTRSEYLRQNLRAAG